MTFDPNRPDLTVSVIGTGAMGRGIAQVAAQGGMRVRLLDSRAGAAAEARAYIERMLGQQVEKGRMAAEDAAATVARLSVADKLADLADSDLVVEAIVEALEPKQALFSELEGIVRDDCILASNTSSLVVAAIGVRCKRPERVAGFHFFNPVPLMKLVEVIAAVSTAPWVTDALMVIGRRMGRVPVRCNDTPGFIVNHAGRAYGPESIRIVAEGIAGFTDIDRVLREAAGFRMGPFELLDLTGLDVSYPVMQSIYNQYHQEAMYRPNALLAPRVAAGMLGRKSGRGFYAYTGGKMETPPEPAAPTAIPAAVWIDGEDGPRAAALTELAGKLGVKVEGGRAPGAETLRLIAPLGEDVTTTALKRGLDPQRTIAVDTLLGLDRRRTIMAAPNVLPAYREQAHGLLASDGVPVTVIGDSPGFIAQRVIAMIVNVGCMIAQQGVAAPGDIDLGVKLGLNYPFGPLEWGDRLGASNVLAILDALHAFYRDSCYRASPWLLRRARLGMKLTEAAA